MSGGERTEQPTPRRKEDARKKGQVARSVEVNSALILLCTFLFLKYCAPWLCMQALAIIQQMFSRAGQVWAEGAVNQLAISGVMAFAVLALPVLGIAFLASVVANMAQVGLLFTPSVVQPKLERINPIEGVKKIFSRKAVVELIKALTKVGIAGYIAYTTIRSEFELFPALIQMSLPDAISVLANLACTIVLRIGVFLLALAAADYAFQYIEHQKSLRMTKQEVKEEFRQYEGDPQQKGKRKEIQRKLSMQRMMQQVPQADVVITNPTHYAVALKYEINKDTAPVVLAKGVGEVAQRIKRIAEENEIIIYEDPPLAQTLYKTVEIGGVIPEHLYEAVANVLSFVYRLRPEYLKQRGMR
ncbi:MAG: flagellar biosynthesis protein FlhB [Syntrophaceticus sp.]